MSAELAVLIRIVDDDLTVCEAQSFFLRMAGFDVATYENPKDFLSKDDLSRPGCMILDVRMPEMTGLELQMEMKRQKIDLPIIFLSAHGDIEMAIDCVQKGAFNFLVKPPVPEKLLELVEEAVKKNRQDRRQAQYVAQLQAQFETLTPAERRVAVMIAKGLSNKVVAETLGVSERTVQTQRANVYAKLECENAVEVSEFLHETESLKA